MVENILWFLLGTGILFGIVLLWFMVYYWTNPQVENPDGKACITGRCGDTMEISLKFNGDQVVKASHWTNGCAHSLNCVCAAADLAMGKTPDEIVSIDADMIQKAIGGLPEDQMHCARLAEETLQSALEDYMSSRQKRLCCEHVKVIKK